ncbi:MAG: hypothetical protein JO147_04925 [Actinobacteria bacterium]|nr:hypothetical protein [Actinomycetota bacterium]
MEVTALGFATDLMVRRLGGSTVEDHDDYIVVRTATNPGFYWGNFVLLDPRRADAGQAVTLFRSNFPTAATSRSA